MTTTLTLLGAPTGNCFRAAIALEEAGIDYIPRLIDLRHGEQLDDAFLSLNPAGKVPVLLQGDAGAELALTQSNAIVFHADRIAPGTLAPDNDEAARAIVMERYFYFLTDVIAFSHVGFRLRLAGFGPAAAELGQRVVPALARAEQYLADGPWIAGAAFSMADIAAYTVCASYADEIDWDALPRMRDWFARSAGRPAVMRGMQAFWRHAGQ